MTIETKEINDSPHKEVLGVTQKQNFAIEKQNVLVRNAGVKEVEGVIIGLDNLVEVFVGQVEGGSFVGKKFKLYPKEITVVQDLGIIFLQICPIWRMSIVRIKGLNKRRGELFLKYFRRD